MANVFANILDVFKGKENSFLGIDLGASSIKVAQVGNKAGKAVLETYGEIALGPYGGIEAGRAVGLTPEKMIEALNDVLKEAKVSVDKCATAIPLYSSLVSIFEVPSFSGEELDQLVLMEMRKYIPIPLTEVAVDWQIMPTSSRNLQISGSEGDEGSFKDTPIAEKKEVIAVAIHKDAISRLQDIILRSGKDLKFFELESFSVSRSASVTNDSELIFDMGAGSTKLSIVENNIIRSSHIVNFGSQDITLAIAGALNVSVTEAEKIKIDEGLPSARFQKETNQEGFLLPSLHYIVYEAKKIISEYETKYRKVVSHIILSGGGSNLKGFIELVKKETGIETALANPFLKLSAPAFLKEDLAKIGPSFSVAIGLALRGLSEEA